jgi:hypothetical protein
LRRSRTIPFSARRDRAAAREATGNPPPGDRGLVPTCSAPVCGPSARQLRPQKKGGHCPSCGRFFRKISRAISPQMEVGGVPKNQGPFSRRKLERRNLATCGAIVCLGSSSDKSRLCGEGNPTKWPAGWGGSWPADLDGGRQDHPMRAPRRRPRRRLITRFQPPARMT